MFFTKQDSWYTHDDDDVIQKNQDVLNHTSIKLFVHQKKKAKQETTNDRV
jgi:hypothetical protein